MAYNVPPPKNRPEPGYYYHYKHDPNGPLNNYAYYIYGIGHPRSARILDEAKLAKVRSMDWLRPDDGR